MQEVITLVDQARARSVALNDQLAKKYGLASEDLPISGLNMANQHCVLALESLLNYNNLWHSRLVNTSVSTDQLRTESAQRVVELTKSSFILSLSAFEFCAKQSIALRPKKIQPLQGRIYLRKIIKESVLAGVISATDESSWEGVIELRNTLVHNNGIAEQTKSYIVPGTQGISFKSGQMSEGTLKFFPQVQSWAIEAFARWCDGFLT